MRNTIFLLTITITMLAMQLCLATAKGLHLTFHQGCKKEVEYIAKKLEVTLETMFVPNVTVEQFDGFTTGAARYNIDHEMAQRIFEHNKDYFNEFDFIITSDTAPLARIFLQNDFDKPLIIWVCNRFDYVDNASLTSNFPDQEYYDLIEDIPNLPQVKIVSYTPIEHIYAQNKKNIHHWNLVIKPTGRSALLPSFTGSSIPPDINKETTLFIPPYHNDMTAMQTEKILSQMGIACYNGRYAGPQDLKDFKGIVHIPYSWSNLALFENIQNGVVYFIPSLDFFQKIAKNPLFFFPDRNYFYYIRYSEWYCPENKPLFVFFNSWADLKKKVLTTDYTHKKQLILDFAQKHNETMLKRWRQVFKELNIE